MNNTTESSRLESLLHKVQYDVRSIFYLLTPRETYYKNVNEVPDLTDNALEIFFSFILVEQIIHLLKNGRFGGKLNDAFSSLSAGIISALPYFFMRKIHFSTYEWVHKNFVIYEMPYDSILTYIVTFLFVDMMYYWFHRAAHEVNIFWGAHQTHHSAEEYNFTTALRQSVFQTYTSWFFYLPLAFFVPPSIFMVHSHLNLIYQFWIHTEIVDSIGTFGEFILNTPSHHRVHHGRNPYCIDKNYAGVLIIWDRMFGTFQAEKKDIQLAYGLVHPIQTFDPIYVQVFNYRYIFKRFFEAKNWNERFSVLFKGPGWEEGSPRLGFHEKLPEVQYPIKKYDKKLSYVLNLYALVHFIFLLVQFSTFAKESSRYPSLVLSLVVVFILFSLTSLGQIFDVNVGGWHVSQFLKQALTWKENKDALGATVSSLDTSAVKQKCRLSLNLAREGCGDYRFGGAGSSSSACGGASGGAGGARTETLHIKSQRDSQRRLELTEVTLSSELYLAPEMMYASLDLPGMVQEATKDLPDHLVKDCFSNILVTGGNTDLQGFVQRFSSDLRELMPEHSMIINVCPYRAGNHSWNTVMGANAVRIASPYGNLLEPFATGSPIWMMREEYILFGTQLMAATDPADMEG